MAVAALIRPHALSAREQQLVDFPAGLTVAEMVALFWPLEVARENVVVFVGAVRVQRDYWPRVRPKEGAEVRMALVLTGGGGGSKQILGAIAMIGLAIVAPYAAAAMGFTGLAASAVAAGIVMVGSLAMNALFKPPGINAGGGSQSPAESSTYSLSGQSNQATPYGVVPRVYGRHRIFPRVAAAPYVTAEGPNQFLYMLLDCGFGPLAIENLCIGDTPVGSYADFQFKVHPAWQAGDTLNIYRNDSAYESLNLTLAAGAPQVRVSAQDASEITLEFSCPRGLVTFDDSANRQPRTLTFQVAIRPAGSAGAFTPVNQYPLRVSRATTTSASAAGVNAIAEDPITYEIYPGAFTTAPGFAAGRDNLFISTRTSNGWFSNFFAALASVQVGDVIYFLNEAHTITAVTVGGDASQKRIAITPPLGQTVVADGIFCPMARPADVQIAITDATAQPLFFSVAFDVPAGQYEVQVTRLSAEASDTRTIDAFSWLALRSTRAAPPIAVREPHTILELKVRASEQLSGVLQNVNCIATSILPVLAPGGVFVEAPTRNPAWAYLDVLRGSAALRPLADSRIHLESIAAWAAYCDAMVLNGPNGTPEERVRFDHVVDYGSTTFQLLQSIAAAGRATPTVRDGKHGVIVDEEQTIPVQLFTPRNSWGFQARRVYLSEPNGLRVKFIDPLSWQEGEVIIYAAGFNAENSVTFEELKLFGVTRYTQATRDGLYMKAQALLRREEFEIQCDIESLIATRGDLVAVQHDVLEVGGESSRIVDVAGDTITLADSYGALPTARYGVRIRLSDGTVTAPIEVTPQPPNALRLSAVPALAPAAGDLLAWGFLNVETGEYLVKNIQPGPDFTATLTLAEIARQVYDADTGDIPPYVPPAGARPTADAPPAPDRLRAVQLDRTIGREPFADVVLYWDSPPLAAYPRYRVMRVLGGVQTQIAETAATSVQVDAGVRLLDPDALTDIRRYAVIGVDATGRQSEPAVIDVQLRDPLFIPDAPAFLSSNVHGKTTTLTWLPPADAINPGNGQVMWFEVRWVPLGVPATWGASSRVTELLAWNVTTVTVPSRNGAYLVKAVTGSRVESDDAAMTVTAVEDLVMQDIFNSIRFQPEWVGLFDGTMVDDSGRLTLAPNGDGTYPALGIFYSNSRQLFSEILQCRVSATIEAFVVNTKLLMAAWVPLAIADPLAGALRGRDWDASVWVHSSEALPYVMADWVPLASADPLDPIPAFSGEGWRPLLHGEYIGRQLFFAVVLESKRPNLTPVVTAAGVDIDFPERQESFADVLVPPGGLNFIFSRPFVFPPAVAIDLQDAASATSFVKRGPVAATGFHVDVMDGAANVGGVVDVSAFGVGRALPS